jgi:hypothetical protein
MENSEFLEHTHNRIYSPFTSNGGVGHQQAQRSYKSLTPPRGFVGANPTPSAQI